MHDLYPLGPARCQETNHLPIDDRYFLQVQNQLGPVILELRFQFPDVLRLKVPNQTNRGPAAVRIPFDFQRHSSWPMQLGCQRNSLNRRCLTHKKLLMPQKFLTVQENKRGMLAAIRLLRSSGPEGSWGEAVRR